MFKFNNKDTRTKPKVRSKITKDNRTPFEYVVSVYLSLSFNFTHVSYLVLMFLLSPMNV